MDTPLTVLLVEDSTPAESTAAACLTMNPFDADRFLLNQAHTLEQAVACIANQSVDLILLDLDLPRQGGLDAFDTLRKAAPKMPIILLAGTPNLPLSMEAVRRGAQDYLIKSQLSRAQLTQTILYAIERNRANHKIDSLSGELKAANASLERLSLVDPLTELLNRRGLQQVLSREIQWTRRDELELLALLIDLDDFRRINDVLGHAVGDVVLKEVARKLKISLRGTDYIARISGDKFVVLLPQTRPAEGVQVAEKVRLAISGMPVSVTSKETIHLTASLGLVSIAPGDPSVDELLSRSHPVLYQSKQNGKNCVSAEPWQQEQSYSYSAIQNALRNRERFYAVKQAIFDLNTQKKIGYEFLSRASVDGFEMPDDFFRACIEANILTLVDHLCLKSCLAASSALALGGRCHLNLFPSTIIDIPIQHLLEDFPLDFSRGNFCIEVSEQQIIGDPSYLSESINAFKRYGILIAIDDVGFGRSCLESLIILEPDIVKVDKRFVKGIAQDRFREQSLRRLLKVAKALDAEVVAEGIETPDDLRVLQDLDVQYGQGYLLERPA